MPIEQPADRDEDPQTDHRKSVEYNLEKQPLQTGGRQPSVSLAERFRMLPKPWELHKLSAGWLAVWLIVLLLLFLVILNLLIVDFAERLENLLEP